jgi:hypothetical protein
MPLLAAGDDGKGVPGSHQISALLRSGAINRGLQSPFARIRHDLQLPEPVKGTILAPKARESGECRKNRH